MYNWFLREKDSKYNSLYIKANWVKAIWRVSHPPSYLMAIERNAQAQGVAPEKIDKFYARHAKRFEDVPMDFNIFSKRVISFICGNGIHWVSYYAFHPGELLCENISRSRSGKNRPASFIGFIDPLGPGEDDTVGEFVTFILEVMLHLEKWITAILEMKPGDPMISPKLVQICDESFARCKTKDSIFAKNKRETHQQFYRQGNGWDCGPCCVLNVTAAYVADTEYHQNWREIRNPTDFFRLVHKPFWNVATGGKTHKREVAKRLKIFRFNLIALLEKLLPTPFWHVTFNSTDFTYLLQLRNGQIANAILWPLFLQNYTEGVTTPEQALIKAMKLPAVPTNRLAIVTAKELEIMKSLDVAEDPGTLIGDELSLPVVEAKKSEKVSPPEVDAKKSDAPLSTDKTDAKNLDQTGKTKDTRHTSLENTDLENEGEQKKKRLKITIKIPNKTEWDESALLEPLEPKQTFSPTKRQQKLLQEREEKAGKHNEEQERIEDRKRCKLSWFNESKEWRTNMDGMLAGVQKEMSLGGKAEVLEQLNQLDRLMMKEDRTKDEDDKVLHTLKTCFPRTSKTGEVNDKEVSQISHLKFIPGHMLHGEIYKQVYQGRAGDELVDLINPNWVRWVFDQQFCYYVMRLGVQQWNKYGERRKMTWVPVPLGAARDGNHHQGMLVDTVPIKYPQYDLETCTFMSMASALHYCSSVLKMGDKLVGNTLAQGAVGYIKGMSARAQLDTLIRLVISKKYLL